MRYVSTRGGARELGFADAMLAGMAPDGGLYVPDRWPEVPSIDLSAGYADIAASVIAPYVDGEIDQATLVGLCRDAYGTFRHPDTVPLVPIGDDHWLLELFHGPTLAFKDVALQLLGRLFDHVLAQRSQRLTIVGATSGDTGSAAIDGVKACDRVDIVILYPQGRTSDVQRKQMTTVESPHVHTLAVDGTFDDCQDLVKAMFADEAFRDDVQLAAVNSINWARVMAQIVYYVTASSALDNSPTMCVPTGNFGNVLAGWIAHQMGAPIGDFIVASNSNDILTRFITEGDMSTRPVVPTLSPSMDIQVSSNFERLLFEMNGRHGETTAAQLQAFRSTGRLEIDDARRTEVMGAMFRAASVDDDHTLAEIGKIYRDTAKLIDPHTATATAAARRLGAGPVVSLATAHPAKFPDAVTQATGRRPDLPDHLADLFERPERITPVANDLSTVRSFVRSISRV